MLYNDFEVLAMDLRIVKTRKAIRTAFFSLRGKTPLEKVKVVDLCGDALINKTTFYKYYDDIFNLSSELEDEMFESFWQKFSAEGCLYADTRRFIMELPSALDSHSDYLVPLYHDRTDAFFTKLEWELLKHYVPWDGARKDAIRSCFFLCGLVRMLREIKEHGNYTLEELADELASFSFVD